MLYKRIQELEAVRNEIITAVGKVTDSTLKQLLVMRYIDGMTWERIADKLYYSDKYIKTALHIKALQEIERMIHI